ncbi:MAG: AAA family ATPase [Candidatus Dormibacteria bacterium]
MEVIQVRAHADRVLQEVERVIVGKRAVLELILSGILADGHILLEDYPGLAKTLIARSFAQSMKLGFARVQFTPDLMPSDITGSSIYNQQTREFQMRPGPIFTNLLLGDEINRSPPKTQAALLEGMQERQVTIEGRTAELPRPFLVLATQNPIEYEGTYPLPEAQLDRFLLRASIGYPEAAEEERMLRDRHTRQRDDVRLNPVVDGATVLACQAAVETVLVTDDIFHYIVELVRATRQSQRVVVGASPRGSLALLKVSRARAALLGRDFVVPDDVQALAVPALAHRLTLRPELWAQRIRPDDVVRECLTSVPVPPTLPADMMTSLSPAAEAGESPGQQ